eukprot:scaffold7711_cov27-Prasinocladus_malaysianus.AAC.1
MDGWTDGWMDDQTNDGTDKRTNAWLIWLDTDIRAVRCTGHIRSEAVNVNDHKSPSVYQVAEYLCFTVMFEQAGAALAA